MRRARLIVWLIMALGTGALLVPATASAAFDATATTVTCAPASVTTGAQTTCTASVTDTTNAANTPTGTVTFNSSPATATFGSSGSCSLSAVGGGSCQVTFKPSAGGAYNVTATYGGDTNFQPSTSAPFTVTAVDPTTTSLSCSPTTVPVNSSTQCTAVVSDPNGGTTPAGQLNFSSSPSTGKFGPVGCRASGPGSATCDVTFTPLGAGRDTMNASYSGDTYHAASSGSSPLTATTSPAGGGPGSHGGATGTLTISISNGPPAPGTLSLARRAKVSKKGLAVLTLSCAGGSGSSCAGALFLTTKVKVKVRIIVVKGRGRKERRRRKTVRRTKTILVGSANYDLSAGSSRILFVRVSKAAGKVLKRKRKIRSAATAAGSSLGAVTLVAPKHRKHHRKKHHRRKH